MSRYIQFADGWIGGSSKDHVNALCSQLSLVSVLISFTKWMDVYVFLLCCTSFAIVAAVAASLFNSRTMCFNSYYLLLLLLTSHLSRFFSFQMPRRLSFSRCMYFLLIYVPPYKAQQYYCYGRTTMKMESFPYLNSPTWWKLLVTN